MTNTLVYIMAYSMAIMSCEKGHERKFSQRHKRYAIGSKINEKCYDCKKIVVFTVIEKQKPYKLQDFVCEMCGHLFRTKLESWWNNDKIFRPHNCIVDEPKYRKLTKEEAAQIRKEYKSAKTKYFCCRTCKIVINVPAEKINSFTYSYQRGHDMPGAGVDNWALEHKCELPKDIVPGFVLTTEQIAKKIGTKHYSLDSEFLFRNQK